MQVIELRDIASYVDKEVALRGWIFNMRSSGKIHFLLLRDGTGAIQAVVDEGSVSEETIRQVKSLTLESSVELTGTVKKEPRAQSGFELVLTGCKVFQIALDYPIGKKDHGVDFLLDQRHLWIRSSRQRAILSIRDEVIWALRSYFKSHHFRLTDTPILTPTSCEGTTTLFATDYFDEKAYLSQSGQLYLEALCMAFGKVYDFGPVFRAEKSKTRRHLTEFWMLDAEVAFSGHEENLALQEDLLVSVTKHILETCGQELTILERDIKSLEKIQKAFIRLTYTEALEKLKALGSDIKEGEDFGNDDETLLMQSYDTPVFVTHYPVALKAFYMQPDSQDPRFALCNDLLLPEGYGEVFGGSERIHDAGLLERRIKEHKLDMKEFQWYVDLRKFGSVPHAGFGVGIERLVAFYSGIHHVRETIPFPRLLHRLRP